MTVNEESYSDSLAVSHFDDWVSALVFDRLLEVLNVSSCPHRCWSNILAWVWKVIRLWVAGVHWIPINSKTFLIMLNKGGLQRRKRWQDELIGRYMHTHTHTEQYDIKDKIQRETKQDLLMWNNVSPSSSSSSESPSPSESCPFSAGPGLSSPPSVWLSCPSCVRYNNS